ncbi:hypothetical protein SEA_FAUST_221 [Streptomyces phage Faust]|uniref:Uncharacterized protein n=1 Tax=Streptomyces phage Faust TaxID=2767565 RepID=A0A7G9UZ38_9CAUD|nr:hypothetical protein PP456_gp066 [Streptomyces phage Faust]QNN99293.1 hypothetical protein SEA_FAUST_221 [Streptomyces phage Faust]
MGDEMTEVDVLFPYQIDVEDYVEFTDTKGEKHSGVVLDIEDLGDVFLITLSDDEEGDADTYEMSANEGASLLMYSSVAV